MSDQSSSEDEANPYSSLVSMVGSQNTADSSDSEADDEFHQPKRRKLAPSSKSTSNKTSATLGGDSESSSGDEDSDSEFEEDDKNNCLRDEVSEIDNNSEQIAETQIYGESDDDEDCNGERKSTSNYKTNYYKRHLEANVVEYTGKLETDKLQMKKSMEWSVMEKITYSSRVTIPGTFVPSKALPKRSTPDEFRSVYHVKKILIDNWSKINGDFCKGDVLLSPLQREFFTLINSYCDVSYTNSTLSGRNLDIKKAYCLHVVNHLLRCRAKVLLHNARLKHMTPEQCEQVEYRDQGITRPRILILVPFRSGALEVVDILLKLLKRGSNFGVGEKKRFFEEFGSDPDEDSSLSEKPEDFQDTFKGNTDEHFRIGIALLRNSVRLYAPFYSSDIIISSPLGMRSVIGAVGEKHYEHDFLSSIEMMILDQTDVFMMQNWEHVLHNFNNLNITPKDSHGVDFSRVRNISLDSQNKFYRQSIVISSVSVPQIQSLFNKFCFNHQGLLTVEICGEKGSICAVAKQLPQVFHKLSPVTLVDSAEVRFKFFVDRIYKQYKESKMKHVVVFIPQYYDFVRVRNYMRKEWKEGSGLSFSHINDYSTTTDVGKAKRKFYTGKCHILLYTERYYFYNRTKIRGMKNLIFYELPTFPHFYPELCNMMRDSEGTGTSASVITFYTKYDFRKLSAIVGVARAREMLSSAKAVHMFVSNS